MDRVDIALVPLQVVALAVDLGDEPVLVRDDHELVLRQRRGRVGAHVREQQAPGLPDGVGQVADLVGEPAARGLAGLLQAAPLHIVEPAVVEATETAVLDSPVAEVCRAVGAVDAQQTGASLRVAEERQVLPEDPHRLGRAPVRQLLRKRDGLPVPAEQRPSGRPRSRLGKELVVLGAEHIPPPGWRIRVTRLAQRECTDAQERVSMAALVASVPGHRVALKAPVRSAMLGIVPACAVDGCATLHGGPSKVLREGCGKGS